MRGAAYLLAAAVALAHPAQAQDEDGGGFLERKLEELLSGEGRDVTITGFEGALSSDARLATMSFSDADGIWLRLEDVELVWTRSALFLGRLEVDHLSAGTIDFVRPPLPANELPSAEAPGFSLPELPVSVEIGEISADRVMLGQALFGAAAELKLTGTLSLDGGEGSGRIAAERLDGATGSFTAEGSYANATRVLDLNLAVKEAQGGIVSTLAGLPGAPALDLTVKGTGPLDDFAADLALVTDGTDRVTGRLALKGEDGGGTGFDATLAGDVAPLVFPEYQAFFGPDLALDLTGTRRADGSLSIGKLALDAAQMHLAGRAEIGADGLPDLIDLTGRIASADGTPVLLPHGGPPIRIDAADLTVGFDAARGEDWRAVIDVENFDRPGLKAEALRLDGKGRIAGGASPDVTAEFDLRATALDLGDPDAEAVLGENVIGRIALGWQKGAPVEITSYRIDGETYGLDGRATFATSETGLDITTAARVTARDLSVFSGLAGRPLAGSVRADISATAAPVAGYYDVTLEAQGTGLGTGIAELDQLLAGDATIETRFRRDATGSFIDRFLAVTAAARIEASAAITSEKISADARTTLHDTSVIAPDLPGPLALHVTAAGPPSRLDLTAKLDGPSTALDTEAVLDRSGETDTLTGSLTAALDDLAPLASRIGRPVAGAVNARASGSLATDLSRFAVTADLDTTDLVTGQPQADRILAGRATTHLEAAREGSDLRLSAFDFASGQLTAEATGTARTGTELTDIQSGETRATITVLSADGLLPGMPVPLAATIDAAGTRQNIDLALAVTGEALTAEADTKLDLTGATPALQGKLQVKADDIAPFSELAGRTLAGALTLDAEGRARTDLSEFDLTADATTRSLRIGQPDADALLAGAGTASIRATRAGGVTEIAQLDASTAAFTLSAKGTTGSDSNDAEFDLRLADVGRWVPGLPGPATAKGTASQAKGADWTLDIAAAGPGGTSAKLNGRAAPSFDRFDVTANGSLPLQAANAFIAPRAVTGSARFDLRLDGPPALSSVSGRIETADARLSAPALGIALTGLGASIDLAGSSAQVQAGAQIRGGGRFSLSGPIRLAAPFPADLKIGLSSAVFTDPGLYRAVVSGNIGIEGGLAGGARIGGVLKLDETEIRIPSGTAAGIGPSFEIGHVNEPAAVRETRERAGLVSKSGTGSGGSESSGPAYPLDLTISAPNRIFLRGRGLEAELGGELRLGGTTRNVIPSGQFELIRGRLDILGQRLSLSDGTATLQGDFNPYVRLVAENQKDDITIRVIVQGLAASPEIAFTSQPELPQDEVVARLLFDKGIENLSPLQAAQLASAVATLAGKGDEGVVSKLRQKAGLDDLDVTGDGEGGVGVRAGKYLSDDLYSDVTVDSTGNAEVSINLDLSKSVTVRGSASSSGSTGLGVFFERDY